MLQNMYYLWELCFVPLTVLWDWRQGFRRHRQPTQPHLRLLLPQARVRRHEQRLKRGTWHLLRLSTHTHIMYTHAHTQIASLRLARPPTRGGSRVKMQRKLKSSSLKAAAKNKSLITSAFYLRTKLFSFFYFSSSFSTLSPSLRRERSTGSAAVCCAHRCRRTCTERQINSSSRSSLAATACHHRGFRNAEKIPCCQNGLTWKQ